MAITTYSELQTAIKNRLSRADLDSLIPEFITQGEAVLNDKLRARVLRTSTTINPSTTVKYVALPSDFREPISFTDDYGDDVIEVSESELEQCANEAGAGRPEYYALTNQIEFERLAGGTYNYKLHYWKKLDIATDDTNDILTKNPNLYLYSAIKCAWEHVQNEGKAAYYDNELNKAIMRINQRDNRTLSKLRFDMNGGRYDIIRGY